MELRVCTAKKTKAQSKYVQTSQLVGNVHETFLLSSSCKRTYTQANQRVDSHTQLVYSPANEDREEKGEES